jgi:hypothetical protein
MGEVSKMSPWAEIEHYVAYAAMLVAIWWFFAKVLGLPSGIE